MIRTLYIFALFFPSFSYATPDLSQFPSRTSGLWETIMNIPITGGTEKFKECVNEKYDKEMLSKGLLRAQDELGKCDKEMKKEGNTYNLNFKCQREMMQIDSSTKLSGNFKDSYNATTNVKISMQGGMNLPPQQITLNAKRLGDCPENMKPGEIIKENGEKYSISE